MSAYGKNWGVWLTRRAEVVGYRRQQDLADAVGCSRTQLTKWLAAAEPPKQMRKGFDTSLARALQTTRSVLFTSWVVHSPEHLERTIPGTTVFGNESVGQLLISENFDRFLSSFARGLTEAEADEMVAYIVKVVLAKHDERYEAFKLIAEKLGLFDEGSTARPSTHFLANNKPIQSPLK